MRRGGWLVGDRRVDPRGDRSGHRDLQHRACRPDQTAAGADLDRVMLLWGRDDARSQRVVEVSLADQRAWLAGQKSFTAIELFGSVNWGELHITGPGAPFRAVQNAVSSGFFDVLGAGPMIKEHPLAVSS